MRFLLAAVIVLLISFHTYSQPINSPVRLNDSPAKQTPLSHKNLEDSLYRLKMQRDINEKGKDLDKFLADYKEYQESEQRRKYIRIGVGIVFVAALIYGLVRKRRMTKNSNR